MLYKVFIFFVFLFSVQIWCFSLVFGLSESLPLAESQFTIPSSDSLRVLEGNRSGKGDNAKGSVILTFFVLGFVLLGAYFFLKFLSRARSGLGFQQNDLIKVITRSSLKGQTELCVVEVARCFYILGISNSGVHLLEKIIDKEVIDNLRFELTHKKKGNRKTFSSLLASKIGGIQEIFSKERVNFDTEKQVERLKQLSSKEVDSGLSENGNEESNI